MAYRVNFLTSWVILNVGLAVLIELTNNSPPTGVYVINDGKVDSFV